MPLNNKTLQIHIRDVYGVAKAYPVDQAAETFAAIAGTKTLTLATLRAADSLGFAIFNTGNGSVVSIDPHALRDLANAV